MLPIANVAEPSGLSELGGLLAVVESCSADGHGPKLAEAVVRLAPRVVAMEACCGAHYWGRRFRDLGVEVRLIHARCVRPYVKSAKNDARDAEAICEAALRPHMRFVPITSPEQLDIQALHRVREQLVRWRTALINQTRGLLAEHGIVLPQGAWRLRPDVTTVLDDPASELTALAAELFRGLLDQLRGLEVRIATLDHRADGRRPAVARPLGGRR
jgi:transposase